MAKINRRKHRKMEGSYGEKGKYVRNFNSLQISDFYSYTYEDSMLKVAC